ncbi:MAG: LysR family transcriptional regulator [Deltaproteobacteria bacterium]|nr:LysR family transcriptional regulator [Deltaproteobacteria bacterium]
MGSEPLDLTLFELKLFVRASRGRSLREIAREQGLKPAHVSKVIARIEERLGRKLFKRSAAGVQLTPEALVLLRTAEEITELAEQLPARSRAARDWPDALGIGSVSFLHSCLVVPALGRIAAEAKRTRFRVIETPREELVTQGFHGAFELAVYSGELQWPRSWASRKVGAMRYGLYARAGHALGGEVSEEEALRPAYVVPTYWMNQRLSSGNDLCPVSPRRRRWGDETTTATAALSLVQATDQVAFLPCIVADDAERQGLVREVCVRSWPVVERELFVSVRTDAVSQKVFRAVLAAVGAGIPASRAR